MTSLKQTICKTLIVFLMGSLASISAADVLTGSISIQLNSVPSTMSADTQAMYESEMTDFYTNSFIEMNNITVTMISQNVVESGTSRLRRRLQTTNVPLNTILSVSGIPISSTSTISVEQFNEQLLVDTKDNSGVIVYLLKAADVTYFGALTSVGVASNDGSTTTPDEPTVPAPVPAPVAKAPAPASVIVPGPLGFNNPTGVKVSISIATLWFIAVTLGLSILFFYPEEKVPENWKAVSRS